MATTNNRPKISIITTFYNAERFITRALESIATQKVPEGVDLEYVLVNDVSTDATLDVVNSFIENHVLNGNWVVYTPDTNLGCGGARRYGIERATGDYFMFLDADDYYINTDFVYRAYNDIVTEGTDIVEYGFVMNQTNGSVMNVVSPSKITITDPKASMLAIFKDNLIKFNVWCKIYTRGIVESFPYDTSRTFEDVRTVPIWVYNARKVVIMPSLEVNYRAASDSIIRTNWTETRLNTITAIASHFERFKDDFDVLKAMYGRSMVDLCALLENHSSENEGFNEMSKLNTYMLKYLYPTSWQSKTFHVPG